MIWTGKRPALSVAQAQKVLEAHQRRLAIRAQLRDVPSVKQLAEEFGCSTETVRHYHHRVPKRIYAEMRMGRPRVGDE